MINTLVALAALPLATALAASPAQAPAPPAIAPGLIEPETPGQPPAKAPAAPEAVPPTITSPSGITHRFIAFGKRTRIIEGDGRTSWLYPTETRDGQMLPDGNVLLVLARNDTYLHGGAMVVKPRLPIGGKAQFVWPGTQSEVNTAIAWAGNHIIASEAGPRPRIVEVNDAYQELQSIPIKCQLENHHMQSRMARRLANGNFLVPQLLDRVVREYTPQGDVVWEFKTPDEPKEAWPFTAIRLPNGNTLVTCTHANMVLEVDPTGKTVWKVTNADLGRALINDACGAQRLPNGNTVICSYAIGEGGTKLVEVTPDKKVAWTFAEKDPDGIHEVQILDTNGVRVEGEPLR
jgi:hypothetical protein